MISDFLKQLGKTDNQKEDNSVKNDGLGSVNSLNNQANVGEVGNNNPNRNNVAASPEDLAKLRKVESISNLIMEQVKELIDLTTSMNNRIDEHDSKLKDMKKELKETQDNLKESSEKNSSYEKEIETLNGKLEKFIGLYELVTNQFNPFIKSSDDEKKKQHDIKDEELKVREKKLAQDENTFNNNQINSKPIINQNSDEQEKKQPEVKEEVKSELKPETPQVNEHQEGQQKNNGILSQNQEQNQIPNTNNQNQENSKRMVLEDKITGKSEEISIGNVDESNVPHYDIPHGARDEYLMKGREMSTEEYQKNNQQKETEQEIAQSSSQENYHPDEIRSVIHNFNELSHLNDEIKEMIVNNFDDEKFVNSLVEKLAPSLQENLVEKVKNELSLKNKKQDSSKLILSNNEISDLKELYYYVKFISNDDFKKHILSKKETIGKWLDHIKQTKIKSLLLDISSKDEFLKVLEIWLR